MTSLYPDLFELVKECSTKVSNAYEISVAKLAHLEPVCDYLETLSDELMIEDVKFFAFPHLGDVKIQVVVPEVIVYDGRANDFFKMTSLCDAVSFEKTKTDDNEEAVLMTLTVNGVWVKI